MNEADNKIIDKIEKLIALSSSDNENEAKAAMLKAQELMDCRKFQVSGGYFVKTRIRRSVPA